MLRLFLRLRRIATFRQFADIAHCVRTVTHFANRTVLCGQKTAQAVTCVHGTGYHIQIWSLHTLR